MSNDDLGFNHSREIMIKPKIVVRHCIYKFFYLDDRKRRNDGEEIATTHTPKKVCKSAVFLPPPPAASTTINVFPQEVINELKNKIDKRPNTVQPSSSIMEPPASCQKGLVQLMERNRKAPSYSTSSATSRSIFANRNSPSYSASTASRSTAASRYNIPSYRTSGTSNVSNFDSASTTSTTSSIFSRSFVPKERPKQKKPDEKCSIS
uniref:Uncharacterized protein n=1 Tax=Panagrolaimus superbus TaxID=310955 RepID=A0A914YFV0_9BILA